MRGLLIGLICLTCFACTERKDNPPDKEPLETAPVATQSEPDAVTVSEVTASLGALVRLNSTQLRESLQQLEQAIHSFLENPREPELIEARQAWLEAHHLWTLFTSVSFNHARYTQEDQLFDSMEDEVAFLETQRFVVDASPLLQGFLDGIPGYPDSGLVMDQTIVVSEEMLRSQNGITDPEEVALGFHPIEYFLWQRSLEDFSPLDMNSSTQRRRQILALLVHLLIKDTQRYLQVVESLMDTAVQDSDSKQQLVFLFGIVDSLLTRMIVAQINEDVRHNQFSEPLSDEIALRFEAMDNLVNSPVNVDSLMRITDPAATDSFLAILKGHKPQEQKLELKTGDSEAENVRKVPIDITEDLASLRQLLDQFPALKVGE